MSGAVSLETMNQLLIFTAPRRVELVEESVPQPADDELLVQTICSGISAGTEMLMYRGEFPPDLPADSNIAALGQPLRYPFRYGYAAVGRVVACGSTVSSTWLDQRVFSFQPHQSHFVATPKAVLPVPEPIASESAVLLPNMETAVSFVMDARPAIGEKVLVLGQGVVGLLTTSLLARFPLAQLVSADRFALRRDWSKKLGAARALDPDAENFSQTLEDALAGQYAGADLTLELSGNPHALNTAIAATGYSGRILIGSWYGQKRAPLDLGGAFHRSKIRLISSQVSEIAPQWSGRWSKARRLNTAWRHLAQTDLAPLITNRFPFHDAPAAYRLIDTSPERVLQVVLMYE